MTANVFSVISFLELTNTITITSNSLLYIAIAVVLLFINYRILIANGKSSTILIDYEEKVTSTMRVIFIVYLVVSVLLCAYTAYLVRNR
jgi:hypothetical protein